MFSRARTKRREANTPPLPLVELGQCVDRLQQLIHQTVEGQKAKEFTEWKNSQSAATTGAASSSNNANNAGSASAGGMERKASYANILKKGSIDADDDDNDNNNIYNNDEYDDDQPLAQFLSMDATEEEEIVELMRRIAELVVQGEQRAAIQLQKASMDSNSNSNSTSEDDMNMNMNMNIGEIGGVGGEGNENAIFEYFCEANVMSTMINISTGAAFAHIFGTTHTTNHDHDDNSYINMNMDEQDSSNERNDTEEEILTNLKDTNLEESIGITHTTTTSGKSTNHTNPSISKPSSPSQPSTKPSTTPTMPKKIFLPSISIAIQAIQSISILISNVSRATSLYFLLSNNKVNDLINLPLELYSNADHDKREREASSHNHTTHKSINNGYYQYNNNNNNNNNGTPTRRRRRRIRTTRRRRRDNQSAELSELTTGFVAFLKSLAMRMNPETLQFYLTYHTPASASASATTSSHSNNNNNNAIQFPLYARALQFCDPEEDAFVRTTAMNICLNTLRLATKENEDEKEEDGEEDEEDEKEEGKSQNMETPLPTQTSSSLSSSFTSSDQDEKANHHVGGEDEHPSSNRNHNNTNTNNNTNNNKNNHPNSNIDRPDMKVCPDGTSLHLSGALPFQERSVIAHYVCDPSRVQNLTEGIFMKLAKLCGSVEEAIRTMDTIDGALTACFVEAKYDTGRGAGTGTGTGTGTSYSMNSPSRSKMSMSNNTSEHSNMNTNTNTNTNTSMKTTDAILLDIDKQSRVNDEKAEIESLQMERIKHVKIFQDAVADFQDEFYLLEDVLQVGLVPLNEQVIEMMFATVIYPTVLTPLQLFPKIDKKESEDDIDDDDGRGNEGRTPSSVKMQVQMEPNPFGGSKSVEKYMVKPSHARGYSASSKGSDFQVGSMELLYDSSLAKTALFVVACIYHYISHKQLLHLLTTALLHPFAPKVSCDHTLVVPLEIVHRGKDGKIRIRTEDTKKDDSKCFIFGNSCEITSSTGTMHHSESRQGNKAQCTFVLTPALSKIFHSSTTGCMPKVLQQKVRSNPFRRTILSCLSGTDGMEELQFVAVYAMDAIISTSTASVLKGIILSGNSLDETDAMQRDDASVASDAMSAFSTSASNYMIEFIASMCASLMTATISLDGLYCLKYNDVAAHAIYCAVMIDNAIQKAASKLLDHKRRQSGSFMSQMPSRLKTKQKVKKEDRNSLEYDLKMDSIFFDDFCEGGKSVVENTQRKQNKSSGSLWDGPGYIPVAKDGCINDLSKYVQEDLSINLMIGHDEEETAYRCGANSAVAHLQLDAFTRLLKENIDSSMLTKQRGYIGVSALAKTHNSSVESSKYGEYKLLSPLSHLFGELLFGEDVSSTANPSPETPQPGSIITLVGRSTFPCVCEVTVHTESLFTDGHSLVVAEGLKWQSLYLVLLGKHMILTETVKGDSGSNGRVITSCPLSCLDVQNDKPIDDQNAPPARRLFIVNFSPELNPPRLFDVDHSDTEHSYPSPGSSGSDEVRITRSELGLWFEDENASAKAYKALWTRINKARSKRGQKIREVLAHDDRHRFQSLFKL